LPHQFYCLPKFLPFIFYQIPREYTSDLGSYECWQKNAFRYLDALFNFGLASIKNIDIHLHFVYVWINKEGI